MFVHRYTHIYSIVDKTKAGMSRMSPRQKGKIDQKQEQDVLKCVIKDDLKICKEVIDLSEEGRFFQSEGALYLNAR